jgi:transcription initiation factor TFIIIB Brf1 subunit/transcription initiation factor TFIIB
MSKPKVRCPNCGSSQAYIRIKSGQIVCTDCGTITPKKGEHLLPANQEAA